MNAAMRALIPGAGLVLLALSLADARVVFSPGPPRVDFRMEQRSVASPTDTAAPQPAFLSGSSIAAVAGGAMVIDADSGQLLRADASGKRTHRLMIGADASQLVVDPVAKRVMVANRNHDRIEVISMADESGALTRKTAIKTYTEPFGLALAPDRKLLLVTTVADPRVTAYDLDSGAERWTLALPSEPRGVAVSPDGRQAIISFLNTAAVAHLELKANQAPAIRFTALASARRADQRTTSIRRAVTAFSHQRDVGRRHARAGFATSFLGNRLAVVAHQTSAPKLTAESAEQKGTYGGGDAESLAVDHRLTFLSESRGGQAGRARTAQAVLGLHQPRAMAYDGTSGTLYIAGLGSDEVIAIGDANRPGAHMRWKTRVTANGACGPNGLAVSGDRVLVYCSLSRRIVAIAAAHTYTLKLPRHGRARRHNRTLNQAKIVVPVGEVLAKSRLSESAQRGRETFRRGNDGRLSGHGILACTSCHPEARSDGLSWRIGGKALQTPLLAARIAGTHPYKWDGGDPTIQISLRSTVTRLGGRGITVQTASDLEAYLTSLPRPRAPKLNNRRAVARGKKLFRSSAVGCARCHRGAKLTNRKKHDLAQDLEAVDTPSLIGLAVSAPYYHDGSAATLRAVLREKGTVHSMGDTSKLSERQTSDLIAYLKTL